MKLSYPRMMRYKSNSDLENTANYKHFSNELDRIEYQMNNSKADLSNFDTLNIKNTSSNLIKKSRASTPAH